MASAASRSGTPAARPSAFACDLRRRLGRLEPDGPSHHPSQRQAAMERGARRVRAWHAAAGHERRGRGSGLVRPRRVPRRRPCSRALRPRPPIAASAASRARPPQADDESADGKPALAGRERPRQGLRRFPERRDRPDVKLAAREGFRIAEHLKRYTTLGMATDQGKTGNRQRRGDARRGHRPLYRRGRHHHVPPALSRRSPSAPLPAITAAQDFRPARLTPSHRLGRGAAAPCSSRPGRGCARCITRSAGETSRKMR